VSERRACELLEVVRSVYRYRPESGKSESARQDEESIA